MPANFIWFLSYAECPNPVYTDSVTGTTYCYFMPTTSLVTYDQAKVDCESYSGTLARIDSSSKWTFITSTSSILSGAR